MYNSTWSEQEDLLLASLILRFTREGQSLSDSIEQSVPLLQKEKADCLVRWETELQSRFQTDYHLAQTFSLRKQALQNSEPMPKKEAIVTQSKPPKTQQKQQPTKEELLQSLASIQDYLTSFEENSSHQVTLQIENQELKKRIQQLEQEKENLLQEHQFAFSIINKAKDMFETRNKIS